MNNILHSLGITYSGSIVVYVNTLTEAQLVEVWEKILPFTGYTQTSFCKKYNINQGNFSSWKNHVKKATYYRRNPLAIRAIKSLIIGNDISTVLPPVIYEPPLYKICKHLHNSEYKTLVLVDADNVGIFIAQIIDQIATEKETCGIIFMRKDSKIRYLIGREHFINILVVESATKAQDAVDHLLTAVVSDIANKNKNLKMYVVSNDYFASYLPIILDDSNIHRIHFSHHFSNWIYQLPFDSLFKHRFTQWYLLCDYDLLHKILPTTEHKRVFSCTSLWAYHVVKMIENNHPISNKKRIDKILSLDRQQLILEYKNKYRKRVLKFTSRNQININLFQQWLNGETEYPAGEAAVKAFLLCWVDKASIFEYMDPYLLSQDMDIAINTLHILHPSLIMIAYRYINVDNIPENTLLVNIIHADDEIICSNNIIFIRTYRYGGPMIKHIITCIISRISFRTKFIHTEANDEIKALFAYLF